MSIKPTAPIIHFLPLHAARRINEIGQARERARQVSQLYPVSRHMWDLPSVHSLFNYNFQYEIREFERRVAKELCIPKHILGGWLTK